MMFCCCIMDLGRVEMMTGASLRGVQSKGLLKIMLTFVVVVVILTRSEVSN